MSEKMGDEKVRVRFVTKYDEFRVPDSPFSLPSKLGRNGLSEVVNHLLELTHSPQPFDFMIENRLLRVPLIKFLRSQKMSLENIIVIEYAPAVILSDDSLGRELPSWIGAIDCSVKEHIIAGGYDGNVQLLSPSDLSENYSFSAHSDPIRCISVVPGTTEAPTQIFTGSKDHSLKSWSLGEHGAAQVASFNGHFNGVESLYVWGDRKVLLSGDWSGNIFGWSLDRSIDLQPESEEKDGVSHSRKRLKKKGDAVHIAEVREIRPLFTLRAHTQSTSGIQGMLEFDSRVLSCSWDHSLKEWDMEAQNCITTFAGSKVMTSLHYSLAARAVITSHTDGKVRMWDTRQREETSAVNSFGAQSQWISQVRWHPTSQFIFASVDYDGRVKVWDSRASVPLGSTSVHDGKALCLDWFQSGGLEGVVSGGSDCTVKRTTLIK